ncbi:MAG: hypothetical protein KKE44_21270 [Proteobacteria bacterium]|nr:hypothetical protein [Pseudomonadota bacterium]MBU1585264.1 hypothetical protein [Pseudomonadota bacterium]MBU2451808.1 hypothetical protein [Pseudomonadota bacterium]MBU2630918.1 hypothetical protein [Pseudomonadota bacterium]
MVAQKILLDNATLNQSVRILGGELVGQIDDEIFSTSLNTLISTIVLYNDIYAFKTNIHPLWVKSKFYEKLKEIIKPITLGKNELSDLAQYAFAKSYFFVDSLTGNFYVDETLKNAIKQLKRKNIVFENTLKNTGADSNLFDSTEIRHTKIHANYLTDLFTAYCKRRFGNNTLSYEKSIDFFIETYGVSIEFGLSLLYWLVYRTFFYEIGSMYFVEQKKKYPPCTYFPNPIRAEIHGVEADVMNENIFQLYKDVIRRFDEDAAREYEKKTGLRLVITPIPTVFKSVIQNAHSLEDVIDAAIDLRQSREATKLRQHLTDLKLKAARGDALISITRNIAILKDLVYSEWDIDPQNNSHNNMVFTINPSISIGWLKVGIGSLSVNAISKFRKKRQLSAIVKFIRPFCTINREVHSVDKWFEIPVIQSTKLSKKRDRIERIKLNSVIKHAEARSKLANKAVPYQAEVSSSSFYGLWDS